MQFHTPHNEQVAAALRKEEERRFRTESVQFLRDAIAAKAAQLAQLRAPR